MITIFFKNADSIASKIVEIGEQFPACALWVDVFNPSAEEKVYIEQQLNVVMPSKEEVWENDTLNRFYTENEVLYMTAALISKHDWPHPFTSAVTFMLHKEYLITMREISPTSFQNFTQRLNRRPQKFSSGAHILEGLLEEIITRVAHNSEVVVQNLDILSHSIFNTDNDSKNGKSQSKILKDVIHKLGAYNDLNSKISESLHSLNRLLHCFVETKQVSSSTKRDIRTLINDIDALRYQTAFLADKITFQLSATLGMINVEQNVIIKIFSVATVFFMPPTLVSSIYGMNFEFMPELQLQFAYPVALCVMALLAMIPYIYFRRKGWL